MDGKQTNDSSSVGPLYMWKAFAGGNKYIFL